MEFCVWTLHLLCVFVFLGDFYPFPPFLGVCFFLFGKRGGEGEILSKRASDRFPETDRSYEDGRSPKSDVTDVGPR